MVIRSCQTSKVLKKRVRHMLFFRLTGQSIALTLCVVLAVQAASVDDLISGSFNAKAWDERSRLARDVLADVDKLADLVQTPRPWAVAWVEEERAAILRLGSQAAKVRSFQLLSSPEYHHVKLYNHLQEIKKAFRCVIDPATGLQREMYCWAAAALLLGDRLVFEEGVKALQRDKRLPDDTRSSKVGAGSLDIGLRYEMYSRGIQEYLVLPYLSDDFK
jgi:hypothetical protein